MGGALRCRGACARRPARTPHRLAGVLPPERAPRRDRLIPARGRGRPGGAASGRTRVAAGLALRSTPRALWPGWIPPEPSGDIHGRADRLRTTLQGTSPRPRAAYRCSPPNCPPRPVGRGGCADSATAAGSPLRPRLGSRLRGNGALTTVNLTSGGVMNRWTWVVAVVVLFGLAAAPAQADDDDEDEGSAVASLSGESFLASEIGNPGTSTVSGTCNPFGVSTFTFTVTGLAAGPYP